MIAIDSDEVAGSFGTVPGATRAQTVARLVRLGAQGAMSDGAAGVLFRLADAIEAAADKPVIVLDVDELQAGIHDRVTPENLRRQGGAIEAIRRPLAARVLYCVADALDALTPPRPPRYYIAPDGDGEPTLWRQPPDEIRANANPYAVTRRCVNPEVWDLTIAEKFPEDGA